MSLHSPEMFVGFVTSELLELFRIVPLLIRTCCCSKSAACAGKMASPESVVVVTISGLVARLKCDESVVVAIVLPVPRLQRRVRVLKCMYVCMYVRTYVRMYVCMYVCVTMYP